MWINLAASQVPGPSAPFMPINDDVQKEMADVRDGMAAKMTPQQIAKAQRLA